MAIFPIRFVHPIPSPPALLCSESPEPMGWSWIPVDPPKRSSPPIGRNGGGKPLWKKAKGVAPPEHRSLRCTGDVIPLSSPSEIFLCNPVAPWRFVAVERWRVGKLRRVLPGKMMPSVGELEAWPPSPLHRWARWAFGFLTKGHTEGHRGAKGKQQVDKGSSERYFSVDPGRGEREFRRSPPWSFKGIAPRGFASGGQSLWPFEGHCPGHRRSLTWSWRFAPASGHRPKGLLWGPNSSWASATWGQWRGNSWTGREGCIVVRCIRPETPSDKSAAGRRHPSSPPLG